MTASPPLKMMPYGVTSFARIRRRSLACVDKTRFIEALENCGADCSILVRPRRFGKTLATTLLEAYYDEAAADQFEKTFAGTYIGAHKTPLASQFRVLHLDFSGIASPKPDVLEKAFQNTVLDSLSQYFGRYPHPQQDKVLEGQFDEAASLLSRFFTIVSQNDPGARLYVIIDEHDQFANEILSGDPSHFKTVTPSWSFLKNFYAKLKLAANDTVERIFITGVTSISLDSMTSGFNIAANCTMDPAFADLYGFTETELRELAPQAVNLVALGLSLDSLMARLKEWYDGYRFSPYSDAPVFNPTMCLSYLRSLQRLGKEPPSLLDPNLGQDLRKIESILRLGDADFVRQTVELALRREPIPFSGALQTLSLNPHAQFDNEVLLSALFYFGFLTFGPGDKPSLVIPNRAVSIPFFEYFLKHILGASQFSFVAADFTSALKALADGDPKPLFDVTCSRFQNASGRPSHAPLRESDFQTLLIGALNFSNACTVTSEVEVLGEEKGGIVILATPSAENRTATSCLIEVKHLTPEAATDEAKAQAMAQAWEQISRCEKADPVKNLPKLTRVAALFVGLKLETLEIR